MSDWTVEKFIQRVLDLGLCDRRELELAWGSTRDPSLDEVIQVLLGRELLTNLQVDRILRGERQGFYYGKWKVLYLIGTGSFARVYRSVHRETGEVRAVKVLRKRYRESLADMEQFLREGKMGAQLRHVNVVPIYEIDGDPRAPFMVMEFVEGENLRDLVRVRKKFDAESTVKIVTDICAGLAYAAEKGITHRDLKMSNVLLTSSGRAKLVDFGLAAAGNLKNEKELADCPSARAIDYACLERSTGVRKDDIRSDLFFTGCIMYHCLTGEAPLYETKDRIQRLNFTRFRDIKPVGQLEPDLPLGVVQFLNRAMDLDPSKRFQNPAEMYSEIRALGNRLKNATEAPESTAAPENGDATAAETAETNGGGNQSDETAEGQGKTVLIVETHAETQNLLREQLKKRGYRVLIMGNPDRVFSRFEDDPETADCVVFCTTELKDDAVEAFNRFGHEDYSKDVPALLLVGVRRLAEAAETAPHRALLPMPLKVRNLRLALHKLCTVAT